MLELQPSAINTNFLHDLISKCQERAHSQAKEWQDFLNFKIGMPALLAAAGSHSVTGHVQLTATVLALAFIYQIYVKRHIFPSTIKWLRGAKHSPDLVELRWELEQEHLGYWALLSKYFLYFLGCSSLGLTVFGVI